MKMLKKELLLENKELKFRLKGTRVWNSELMKSTSRNASLAWKLERVNNCLKALLVLSLLINIIQLFV